MDQKLEERLERIERILGNLSSNPGPEVYTRNVPFSLELEAEEGVLMEEPCPLTGNITEVDMHFPGGCDGYVGLQFGHKDIAMFPAKKGEYIALNDTTIPFRDLKESVVKGEKLWAELINRDLLFPHKPSVLVVIVGVE